MLKLLFLKRRISPLDRDRPLPRLLCATSLASSNHLDSMSDILCIRDTLGLCSPVKQVIQKFYLQVYKMFSFPLIFSSTKKKPYTAIYNSLNHIPFSSKQSSKNWQLNKAPHKNQQSFLLFCYTIIWSSCTRDIVKFMSFSFKCWLNKKA